MSFTAPERKVEMYSSCFCGLSASAAQWREMSFGCQWLGRSEAVLRSREQAP